MSPRGHRRSTVPWPSPAAWPRGWKQRMHWVWCTATSSRRNILLAFDTQGRDVPKILDFGIVATTKNSVTLSTLGLKRIGGGRPGYFGRFPGHHDRRGGRFGLLTGPTRLEGGPAPRAAV